MADPDKPTSDEELLSKALPMPEDDADLESLDDLEDLTPIDVENLETSGPGATKITQFGGQRRPHEQHWERRPNANGTGAIHVKTFVTKLRLEAVDHLDQQVNEWLDAHPEYEVKLVTTTIGTLVGKNTEEALFMNVWV